MAAEREVWVREEQVLAEAAVVAVADMARAEAANLGTVAKAVVAAAAAITT